MRNNGSTFEFTTERNEELLKSYRMILGKYRHIDTDVVAEELANSPTSRFWVSEERAAVVVGNMMNGKNVLDDMRPTKREMFSEIFRRTMELKDKMPHLKICDLVSKTVNSPAPKFYMTPRTAMETIRKIMKGYYKNRTKNK